MWLTFVLSAVVVVFGGGLLSRYGDQIAVRTGLGGAWVGTILLAGATSLPEVATSVTASWGGAGNLAMGNVFGSNVLNIAILVLVQAGARKPILPAVSTTHVTVATAGILLSGIASLTMAARSPVSFLGAGIDTWVIAFTYLAITRVLPRDSAAPEVAATTGAKGPQKAPWLRFAGAALLVIVAAKFLGDSGEQIAAGTGLGQTFVGSTLLALTTSLPEVTVSVMSAWRGAYDLAVGNLLGSNIFNMLVLLLADLAYPGGSPILLSATPGQLATALVGLVLSAIAVLGLTVRDRKSQSRFQWDTVSIGVTYIVATWILFTLR